MQTSAPDDTGSPAATIDTGVPRLQGMLGRWRDLQRSRIAGLHDLPARLALRAANSATLRPMLEQRYRRAVARHAVDLPTLPAGGRIIVDALRRDGVFVTSLAAMGIAGSAAMQDAAAAAARAFAKEAQRRIAAGSDFNVVPAAAILAAPHIFRWGIDHRLLAIAEAYLELPVAYDGVSVNYTVADGREVSTRKWHRDWEDRRMLKVAVYLNAVDADGGPFEMISRADAIQRDADGFRYELASDTELDRVLGAEFRDKVVSCTGPAGTVVFADTAGYFHRGRPATARDRAAVFYSYFARPPRHPFLCERSGLSRADIAALSVGLTPIQQAATGWRRALPWLLRLIPSARI